MKMRIEKDALGEMELPDEVYYGIQSLRAVSSYDVSPKTFNDYPNVMRALAEIKKACALANRDIGALVPEKAEAIAKACDELIAGKFQGHFPVNVFRGCGTSANMNANEVIANRANELLTGQKGNDQINPNTHVNMGQSSNDVFPAAESIVLYRETGALLDALLVLEKALEDKVVAFEDVVKLGRTSIQDALPITLGQTFSGYLAALRRNKKLLENYRDTFRTSILGATAIGTGLGIMPGFLERVYVHLSTIVGFTVSRDENFVDGMQNSDFYLIVSAYVKAIACTTGKIADNIRFLSSGPQGGLGELNLPEVFFADDVFIENSDTFVADMMIHIMHQVNANDWGVTLSVPSADADIHSSAVVNFMGVLESMELLTKGAPLFAKYCIEGMTANKETCRQYAEGSTSLATLVSALFGYPIGSKIAKIAYEEGITCKEAALRTSLLEKDVAEELFDVKKLTQLESTVAMFEKYKSIRTIK